MTLACFALHLNPNVLLQVSTVPSLHDVKNWSLEPSKAKSIGSTDFLVNKTDDSSVYYVIYWAGALRYCLMADLDKPTGQRAQPTPRMGALNAVAGLPEIMPWETPIPT